MRVDSWTSRFQNTYQYNKYRMNRAFLIGVNHNDPFARKNTISIMNNLKNMGVIPDFIAVEWSKENADKLISSRPLMTKKLQETFPLFSDTEIRQLSETLAFEADCGKEVFPKAQIVWLDNARNMLVDSADYVEQRVNIYYQASKRNNVNSFESLREQIIQLGNNVPKPSIRDQQFMDTIINKCPTVCTLICVIGANHTHVEIEGTFAKKLSAYGFRVICFDTTQLTE